MELRLSQVIEGLELACHARRLSRHTLADYGNTFGKPFAFLDGDPVFSEVMAERLRGFLAAQDGVSAKTVLNYHTGLSALWSWATMEGPVEGNSMRQIRRPRPEMRAAEPYSREEVRAMLWAVDVSRS